MVNHNYNSKKILILLNENCITARFYPLIPYKQKLVDFFISKGIETRDEVLQLSDLQLLEAGLPDTGIIGLFRHFLRLYDYKGKGIKDISDVENRSEEEIQSFLELMHLPGVKNIRANLYYCCGLKSMQDFADAEAEILQKKIAAVIEEKGLEYSCPLLKELRTQIAVAKAFVE